LFFPQKQQLTAAWHQLGGASLGVVQKVQKATANKHRKVKSIEQLQTWK